MYTIPKVTKNNFHVPVDDKDLQRPYVKSIFARTDFRSSLTLVQALHTRVGQEQGILFYNSFITISILYRVISCGHAQRCCSILFRILWEFWGGEKNAVRFLCVFFIKGQGADYFIQKQGQETQKFINYFIIQFISPCVYIEIHVNFAGRVSMAANYWFSNTGWQIFTTNFKHDGGSAIITIKYF